jgi:hypothetical protein
MLQIGISPSLGAIEGNHVTALKETTFGMPDGFPT